MILTNEYEKEYLEKLRDLPYKEALVIKDKYRYRVDIFKPACRNSIARTYFSSLDKVKKFMASIKVNKYLIRNYI